MARGSLAAPKIPKHANIGLFTLRWFCIPEYYARKRRQTDKPAAGVTNTEPRDNGYQGASAAAPLILWQFTIRIVHAFTAALNDPSLIEYAKQQGTDIPDLQTTPCQGAEGKTSTY
jgi:hypothetical protein